MDTADFFRARIDAMINLNDPGCTVDAASLDSDRSIPGGEVRAPGTRRRGPRSPGHDPGRQQRCPALPCHGRLRHLARVIPRPLLNRSAERSNQRHQRLRSRYQRQRVAFRERARGARKAHRMCVEQRDDIVGQRHVPLLVALARDRQHPGVGQSR